MELWIKLDEEDRENLHGLSGRSMKATVQVPGKTEYCATGNLWVRQKISTGTTWTSFEFEVTTNPHEITKVIIHMDLDQVRRIKDTMNGVLEYEGILTPPIISTNSAHEVSHKSML